MNKILERLTNSPLRLVAVAVLATLLVAGSGGYFLGSRGGGPTADHDHGSEATAQKDEKQLWTCGMHPWIVQEEPGTCPICGMDLTPKRDDGEAGQAPAGGERKILYWRAPMDPAEIYHEPGKSKMGMDLVPVYEDEVVGGVEVKIDPVTQQNMGIRTTRVEQAPLNNTIRTYGHVTYDETRTAQVNPKFSGWIEKLHVNFAGQLVTKGEPLFEIYSPELFTAQEEYLVAYRNLTKIGNGAGGELLESARRRLANWDVPADQIAAIEKSGQVQKTLTIRSPFSGVVVTNNAVEGTFVKAGTVVYKIADLKQVWVEAHIYEYELPWVTTGQQATMTLPYLPGRVFTGTVSYVYPYLEKKTRDVVIRIEFSNPELTLKPDMYADVRIETEPKGEGLVIPSEAVIRSGERNVVFVDRGNGKFAPREVALGLPLDGGRVQVLTGLAPGEVVVTSGQFLLDSESKLKEAVQKMMEAKTAKPETEAAAPAEDDFFSDMEESKEEHADDFFSDMK